MMTVVDQVRPWLMPSSTLAATTQPQLGAQISSSGTGKRDQPAGDQDGLAAEPVGQGAGEVVGGRLGGAEGEDERQRRGVGGEAEHGVGEQRQHGAFLAEHAADEGVDRDEQAELGEVGPQPEPQRAGRAAGRASSTSVCRARRPVARGPVVGAADEHGEVVVSGAFEQAGGGHGPFAVPAHHHDRRRRAAGRRGRRARRARRAARRAGARRRTRAPGGRRARRRRRRRRADESVRGDVGARRRPRRRMPPASSPAMSS